ncbi:13641_t:CDS:2 [Entrophospora sp. SA101]|nr:13641_t:CDS:2 [Entrophospora sp. SA101]
MAEYSTYDIFSLIFAFFLPPVGVFMKRGLAADFWINIGLTILGFLPGVIHAFYVIYHFRHDTVPNLGNLEEDKLHIFTIWFGINAANTL